MQACASIKRIAYNVPEIVLPDGEVGACPNRDLRKMPSRMFSSVSDVMPVSPADLYHFHLNVTGILSSVRIPVIGKLMNPPWSTNLSWPVSPMVSPDAL